MNNTIFSNLTNFIYVPANKFYKEVQEMLEDEEISFYMMSDWDKIKYNIEKIVKKSNFVISEPCDKNLLLENIIEKIDKKKSLDTNTVLLYADDNNMYELVYFLDHHTQREFKEIYDDTNELSSICNIDLEVIYDDACIIKTNYDTGDFKNDIIDNNNFLDIIYNNFFHNGVIIYEDGNVVEITFTTENPNFIIGDQFIKYNSYNILGLTLLLYIEKSDIENIKISKIIGESTKGRVFIMLLCPGTKNRIWNISKITIENIIKILDDDIKYKNIQDELEKDDKIINPFFFIKKNCI